MPKMKAATTGVANKLAAVKARPKRENPAWSGPQCEDSNGGITQSLLGRYIACPERFRLLTINGLKPIDTFSQRLEYGNMWHVCEEAFAGGKDWVKPLTDYCITLCNRYPAQRDQVEHWFNVCKVQFPVYVEYWSKNQDVKDRTPIMQEQIFHIPYRLPSGRVVYLRGKWDSVDLIGKGKTAGVYLQENKSKGEINEMQLRRQLTFDLQTMMYLIALQEDRADNAKHPILGVRYNVIRRPLSGGEGTIIQKKPTKNNPLGESSEDYYKRVQGIINGEGLNSKGEPYPGPSYFFMRWKVEISKGDIEKFKRECFHPILENVADDYEWWNMCHYEGLDPFNYIDRQKIFSTHQHRHFRLCFGCYNVIAEGGSSDLDEMLATGSEIGLQRVENLFPEL